MFSHRTIRLVVIRNTIGICILRLSPHKSHMVVGHAVPCQAQVHTFRAHSSAESAPLRSGGVDGWMGMAFSVIHPTVSAAFILSPTSKNTLNSCRIADINLSFSPRPQSSLQRLNTSIDSLRARSVTVLISRVVPERPVFAQPFL